MNGAACFFAIVSIVVWLLAVWAHIEVSDKERANDAHASLIALSIVCLVVSYCCFVG